MVSGTTMGNWSNSAWDKSYEREQKRISKVRDRQQKILTILDGKERKKWEKILKDEEKNRLPHFLSGCTF